MNDNNRLYKSDGNNNSYDAWELDLVEFLSEKLEIPFGDAQGILEANPFYVSQAWGKGLEPEAAADFIDSKTSMARGGSIDDDDEDYEDDDEDYDDEDEDEDEDEREYKVMCEDTVTGEREEYIVYNVTNEQRARVVALRTCDFDNPKIVSVELYSKGGKLVKKNGREYPTGSAWTTEHNKRNKGEKWEQYANGGGVGEKITQADLLNQNFKEAKEHIIEIHKRVKLKSGNELLLLKKESGWGIAKYNPKSKKELQWNEFTDKETANYWIDKVDVDKFANGGGVDGNNEVLSFFNSIDYSMLPKAFSEYVRKEILTDDDLQYLSPREPVFLEIKKKVEEYTNKAESAKPTTTVENALVKKYSLEIQDLNDLIEIESDEKQIAIYKQEIEDLQTLIELES